MIDLSNSKFLRSKKLFRCSSAKNLQAPPDSLQEENAAELSIITVREASGTLSGNFSLS